MVLGNMRRVHCRGSPFALFLRMLLPDCGSQSSNFRLKVESDRWSRDSSLLAQTASSVNLLNLKIVTTSYACCPPFITYARLIFQYSASSSAQGAFISLHLRCHQISGTSWTLFLFLPICPWDDQLYEACTLLLRSHACRHIPMKALADTNLKQSRICC